MVLSMGLFEKGTFFLDNSLEVLIFECIPDCLRGDRTGKGVVDKMDGFHSIVQPPSSDLLNERSFVTRRQLERAPSPVVFLVHINFLLDSPNSRLPQSGFGLDLMHRITFLKKGNDRRALSSRCWSHRMMGEGKNDCNDGNMLIIYQHDHMTLFIVPTVHHMIIQSAGVKILLK